MRGRLPGCVFEGERRGRGGVFSSLHCGTEFRDAASPDFIGLVVRPETYRFWNVTEEESRSKTGSMKANLKMLSWRYAALIGIITPESAGMTETEVSADRARWPHLIETDEGSPVFHLDNAARWMAELSGVPVAKCRRALLNAWPTAA